MLLVVLALASGCERDEAWEMRLRSSRPGDHVTLSTSYTSDIIGPDGRHYRGRYSATITVDVIEASDDGIAREQATVLEYVHLRDGVPVTQLPGGSYQLVRAPGTDHMTVEHGASGYVREFFEGIKTSADRSGAAVLNRQQYRTGNTLAVAASTLEGFGLSGGNPASTAVLTVEHADAGSVVLRTAYDAPGDASKPDLRVTATIRIARLGIHTTWHADVTYRGTPAGSIDGRFDTYSIFP